jgi:RNA polymerase sigma-70 factor (ECF subfamily)
MKDLSDGELLAAHRAGRGGAFAELVRRHQESLLNHARGLLGPGSSYEDVVQETFLKLSRERLVLPTEAGGSPEEQARQLSAWLHKVTRNACMDSLRSESRRRRRESEVALRESLPPGPAPVEEEDTRALVQRELERLPFEQREVLALRLLAERSYREIAEITGKKVGTVGWLISEGVRALAARLEPLLAPELEAAPASDPVRSRGAWKRAHGGQ